MCTVSVIATSAMLRLVSNRDEQRTRARAFPPSLLTFDGVRVLAPLDPESGGTWIACNELGLAVSLLNVNPPRPSTVAPPKSRGLIVPQLAGCRSLDEVCERTLAIDSRDYAPFRLVAVQGSNAVEIEPSKRTITRKHLDVPLMLTSSGLGDHEVEGPRRKLFDELMGKGFDLYEQQDVFHAHRWSDTPHLSVDMARVDAWTVSRTIVEVRPDRVTMTYAAEPTWVPASIDLRRVGVNRQRDENST